MQNPSLQTLLWVTWNRFLLVAVYMLNTRIFPALCSTHVFPPDSFLIRYLLQQGYKHSQLVLLTPYLGQLVECQKALSQDLGLQAELGEQDMQLLDDKAQDATELAGTGGAHGASTGRVVRVATIDNFQVS